MHAATFVAATALAGAAQATPVFYTSQATFLAAASAAGITLHLENYETASFSPTNNLTTLASGVNIDSNVTLTLRTVNSLCGGTSDCVSYTTGSGGNALQTYTFDSGAVNAFGTMLGDIGDAGGTSVTITNSNGATTTFVLPNQPSGNENYYGIIDFGATFQSVSIESSDPLDTIYIDNTRWGRTVPEPATALLLGLGLLGASASRRRK